MSGSNNKKKNGLFKFLCFYLVFAIIITVGLIYFHNKTGVGLIDFLKNAKNENKEALNEQENDETQDGETKIEKISLQDKYYLNNVEIEYKKITKGNIVDYDYDQSPNYKLTVNYFEISGLKNKDIEDSINKKIQETVDSLIVDDEIYNENISRILMDCYTVGNFSDVISIVFYKSIAYKKDNEFDDDELFLNCRLDTGEEIELSDIFTEDANVKNIIARGVYNDLAISYGVSNETVSDGDLDKIDYGKIENDVYNIMSKFNKEENHKFYFSETSLQIVIGEMTYSLEYKDFSQYINIYNLVKPTESLYENGNKEKMNYAFGPAYYDNFEYYGKVGANKFLSVFNYYKNYNSETDDYVQLYNDFFENDMSKIISVVENDIKNVSSKKGYFYNINSMSEGDTGEVVLNGERVEVSYDDFDEKVNEVYSAASRTDTGEFNFSFAGLKYQTDISQYNISSIDFIEIRDVDFDGDFELGILNEMDSYLPIYEY